MNKLEGHTNCHLFKDFHGSRILASSVIQTATEAAAVKAWNRMCHGVWLPHAYHHHHQHHPESIVRPTK